MFSVEMVSLIPLRSKEGIPLLLSPQLKLFLVAEERVLIPDMISLVAEDLLLFVALDVGLWKECLAVEELDLLACLHFLDPLEEPFEEPFEEDPFEEPF